MDKISFTGLRNIGAYQWRVPYVAPNVKRTHMIVNLVDDYNGKDLSEYKQLIKKYKGENGSLLFDKDSNFLHIMTSVFKNKNDIPELAINGNVIEPKKETLPLFSYVGKLVRRISNMKDKEFDIRQDFKYGPDGDTFVVPFLSITDLAEIHEVDAKKLIDRVYSPENNRRVAKTIDEHIMRQMLDYLK